MSDIAIHLNENLFYDLALEKSDLKLDSGFESAVIISLFTDARPIDNAVNFPSGTSDLRGWWGDNFLELSEDRTGGEIWLYLRGKNVIENIKNIEAAANNSLLWMIEDGAATRAEVTAQIENIFDLCFRIEIEKPDGNIENFKYFFNWQAQTLKKAV
jgi:phage gp46-like protein